MVGMAHRSTDGEPPFWLDIARQPGVIDVLAALFNERGSLSFSDICSHIDRPGVAMSAVRRLGACGLLRCLYPCSGSWDEPLQPSSHFELTDRGYGFARTMGDLGRWVAAHQRDLAPDLRPQSARPVDRW
jgi:hypothetical protein